MEFSSGNSQEKSIVESLF